MSDIDTGKTAKKKDQPYKPTLGIAYFEKKFQLKNEVGYVEYRVIVRKWSLCRYGILQETTS
jgi:hypothetical protein